jgi:hypothetical protein
VNYFSACLAQVFNGFSFHSDVLLTLKVEASLFPETLILLPNDTHCILEDNYKV